VKIGQLSLGDAALIAVIVTLPFTTTWLVDALRSVIRRHESPRTDAVRARARRRRCDVHGEWRP
jgi:hypothetical protein